MLLVLTACVLVASCGTSAAPNAAPNAGPNAGPVKMRAEVLAVLPHDSTAFTQGLELDGDRLIEGTGLEGASSVRVVDPKTAEVRRKVDLPSPMFGEGVTVAGSKIWQLTWRDGVAFQRDKQTLAEVRRVPYSGEGWGVCLDGQRLVMSDGSDKLAFRDPETFDQVGEVRVRSAGEPVTLLNELECTPDGVYANVWKTDTIVRIDPASGNVTATVDLTGLLPREDRADDAVLNGIAAVRGTGEFLVTGKLWPKMFRVKFVTAS
nr:glutaminyl-peptide cyclotransferase [Actinosynnema sp. ALI-1.44]